MKKVESSDSEEDDDEEEDESSEDAKPAAKKPATAAKKADSDEDEEEEEEEEGPAAGDEEKTELFVGNLAFSTKEGAIRAAFSKFGTITNYKAPTDPQGRPKGFVFIQYGSHKEAQKALDGLNGKEIDGRALRINFSGGAPAGGAAP